MERLWIYISILILTMADTLSTCIGIKSGYIVEGNPLLSIYDTLPVLTCIGITLIVGLLLLLIYKYKHKIRWLNTVLYLILAIKIGVIGIHINWVIQVI